MNSFSAKNFFDLSDIYFADLFKDKENVWEVFNNLEEYIREQFKSGKIKSNYKNRNDVYIGEGTVVHETAEITGPAIIGKNCMISHGAFLRGACLFADNAKAGHAVEVKDSIFLNGSIAGHFNYVGNSIIGNKVNLSAGSILANYRLDKKPVSVSSGKEKYQTGLRKLGAIIGDGSNVGVNSVLNPGTILGKSTIVYPLISVTGTHQENEIIKN